MLEYDKSALDAVFNPRSIAVVGASSNPEKFGSRLVNNLKRYGFSGQVYPINQNVAEIGGYATIDSLSQVPGNIELLLICVPAAAVEDSLVEAAKKGAKAALIYTAGFAETGAKGREAQGRLLHVAKDLGLRLVGPNCLGVWNFHSGMNASPMDAASPVPGSVAFISQSGAFCNGAYDALRARRAGLSTLASIGNMADLQHAELIRYFAKDDKTSVIAAFVEGVRDVDQFLDAVSEAAKSKPVVVLKGGRSKAGQAAALSHTSSLAGDGRVWDSLLDEAGATVVLGSEELFDTAAAFTLMGETLPSGPRVAIITVAGGPGVIAADYCEAVGLEVPNLESRLSAIRAIAPSFASLKNPIDLTGDMAPQHFADAVSKVSDLAEVDVIFAVSVGLDIPELGRAMVEARKTKPVVSCVTAPQMEDAFEHAGIPNFHAVERTARSLKHLVKRGSKRPKNNVEGPQAPARHIRSGTLSEAESKTYLAQFGLPTTKEAEVRTSEQAIEKAQRIGYPVVLKVSSAEVAHKTERGGVMLSLGDDQAVALAFKSMQERFPGAAVLVQEMVAPGVELIIGAQRTSAIGNVIAIGIGGVFAEALNDVVFCRAPATVETVLAAMTKLRNQSILNGYRNMAAVDRMEIAKIASLLSAILVSNSTILEIDLNPIIANAASATIADALIVCR